MVTGVMRRKRTGRSGFTLVELLVVIALIAILMAILFPAINAAMKKAAIARARTEMANIVSAIKAYYTEYGKMPTPDTNGYPDHTFVGKWGTVTDNPKQQKLVMDILRAIDMPHNKRGIVFLEVPAESMTGTDKYDNSYTPSDGYYLDPWENPYIIVMNTDFDEQIGGFNFYVFRAGDDPAYTTIANYITAISPTGSGTFPGVYVGVMSWGPDPGKTNSFLKSW